MAKKTLVTLQVGDTDWMQDFEVSHAERLLSMPNNGGWHLPADSDYQFSNENGITRKRNSRKNTETAETGYSAPCDEAPAENQVSLAAEPIAD